VGTLTRKCSIYSKRTASELVDLVSSELLSAGVSEHQLGAQYLVGSAFMGEGARVLPKSYESTNNSMLECSQFKRLQNLVELRKLNLPIQYIIGNWDFHNICLKMKPPVFIPRPETEELVNLALCYLPADNPHILEIGPGTGAVSLAMLAVNKSLKSTAVERSVAALELTLENAQDLQLSDRLTLIQGRVGDENFSFPVDQKYDLIVSNPPYVLRKDLTNMAPEIYLYEDLRALDGGAEGLDVILPIFDLAKEHLVDNGLILLEVDPCHPHLLPPKLEGSNLLIEKIVEDFQGKERFMVIRKNCSTTS